MKQEVNLSAYVDKYLDDVLSDKEKKQFNRELRYDTDLQEELDLQKKLNVMLQDGEVLELAQQLDAIYEEQYTPWVKQVGRKIHINRKTLLRSVSIAASVAFILFSLTWLTRVTETSVDGIYEDHFETAEISMSFRSAADQVDQDLRKAMKLYEDKEYTEAIVLFENVLSRDNSRIGLNLYSGISHMEIEEYEKATSNFRKIIDHKANAFVESAEFYLGLCYLKTDETEKAVTVFQDIVNRDGYFRKDARKILRKIK